MVRTALITLITLAASIAAPPAASTPTEHWQGTIELPGMTLEFTVRFTPDPTAEGGWAAELDIPVQGVMKAAMSDVVYTDTELGFTFASPRAVFKGAIAADRQTALGVIEQGGQTFQISYKRLSAKQALSTGPRRPQTPQPPFPYEEREVIYRNVIDDITITGTLTIPHGEGPFTAVVMITGSGAQDRNETIMGHEPFRVIADHLGRHKIAVLRSDDRGVGGTTGSVHDSTSENFALDALTGLAFLKTINVIDPARRKLVGHSEGGLVAALAAAQSDEVAFIVMLAESALPGGEILRMQTRLLLQAAGTHTTSQATKTSQPPRIGTCRAC